MQGNDLLAEFQSLFCWKSVWENKQNMNILTLSMFQSLFCWKSVWETVFCIIQNSYVVFQSLFCWKSVWEAGNLAGARKFWLVSILVLLEIGLGEKCRRIENFPDIRFNPCFVGNRSGSWWINDSALSCHLFQSLFCWKSVWESLKGEVMVRIGVCFNPCFVGNRSGRSFG